MRIRPVVLLVLCVFSVVVVAVPVAFVAVMTTLQSVNRQETGTTRAGVVAAALPSLAQRMLPFLDTLIGQQCPDLTAARVIAEVQAESGWNPTAWSEDSNGGAAGLLQINQANWVALGGRPWATAPPPAGADIYDPSTSLALGVKFLCGNLRAMADHIEREGKSIDPLDAMSVCHIAGCGRVINSATGIPQPGEAGCSARCSTLIRRYLDNIHTFERRWSASPLRPGPEGALPPGIRLAGLSVAQPYTGGPTGCASPDPTTANGCLTAATANGIRQVQRVFGPELKSVGCWAKRPWNPASDHPQGKGCDLFPTRAGIFPRGEPLAAGWRMAAWLRSNAEALRVKYVIWQGRYWDPATGDLGGWGTRYTGGGVYDTADPTGGHYDHVHVSFAL